MGNIYRSRDVIYFLCIKLVAYVITDDYQLTTASHTTIKYYISKMTVKLTPPPWGNKPSFFLNSAGRGPECICRLTISRLFNPLTENQTLFCNMPQVNAGADLKISLNVVRAGRFAMISLVISRRTLHRNWRNHHEWGYPMFLHNPGTLQLIFPKGE